MIEIYHSFQQITIFYSEMDTNNENDKRLPQRIAQARAMETLVHPPLEAKNKGHWMKG